LPAGKIIKGVGGLYSVEARQGGGVYLCSARGIFRRDGIKPLAGDDVDFEIDALRAGYGSVRAIGKRRSELARPPVSNVDQMLVVLALSEPAPDFMLADKLILSALSVGIRPLVCANKSDLPAVAGCAGELEGYERAGFLTLRLSHRDGAPGYAPLLRALGGRVTILAGQSGVGKSTLLNGIAGLSLAGAAGACGERMAVGAISERIGRGRHTTRHVELVKLAGGGGGYAVDSPGFSALEIGAGAGAGTGAGAWDCRELDSLYPEFAPYLGQCRFAGCSHIHEPGCAVLDALGAGRLHAGRHGRYAAFYEALRQAGDRKYAKRRRPPAGAGGG
jgi:ribosome biogenesis GTPase